MAELGVGYISIVPETSKIAPEISKALNNTQTAADKQGQGLGSKLSAGMGKTLKVGAASAGVAAGGAIAASLTKGMGRLTAIDSAEAKLRGLGNSGGDVAKIMENANAAVKGTAYGLDAAATTAAMAVASGIKPGKELEQVLKTTADTAAIAGASMDEMGAIFGSVAARGKLQGDDLMQLQSRGIPVLEMLSAQLGKTTEEVSDMVSKGKVDFATFEAAMRDGLGGAALESGNTFKGALENMGAAAGRVGATALKPFFGLMREGFNGATDALDGVNASLKPVAQNLTQFINSNVVPAMNTLKKSLGQALTSPQMVAAGNTMKAVFNEIAGAAQRLAPVISHIGSALGKAAGQLGGAAFNVFATGLSAAASAASGLAGPLQTVTGILDRHPALITAAVSAWAGFKIVPSIAENITSSLGKVGGTVGGIRDVSRGVGDMQKYLQATGKESSKFTAAMMVMGSSSNSVLQKMGQAAVNASQPYMQLAVAQRDLGTASGKASGAVKQLAGVVAGTGAAAFTGMKSAVSGVVDALGGPWGVAMMAASAGIALISDASNRAKAASEQYSSSIANAASINRDFTSAVAGSTGALSEQAQELAAKVADSATAGLQAFTTQMGGFVAKVPPPDMSDFTQRIQEAGDEAFRNMSDESKYDAMASKVSAASKEMTKYLEDTGRSMSDLGEIVAKGGPEFDALVSHMRGVGQGGEVIANELVRARSELEATIEAAQRVDPAMAAASEGIGALADSASSGEDKLKALHSVLQAMGLAPKDAEQAMMDAAAAVDEIVESAQNANRPVEELGQSLFDMNGKLDPSNASARDLASTLNGMRDELANVAVNGGDVQAAFDQMAPAVSAIAQEFGLTEGQVRQLMEAYGVLPNEISTLVSLEGTSEATQEISEVWTALERMQNEGLKQIEIGAVGDEAKAVMDELGIKWEETVGPDGEKNLVISATDEEAIESVQRVTQLMAELGESEVNPKVLLDTTQVEVNAQQAKNIIEALNIENPSPQATLLIDQLQQNHSIAMGDLQFLAQQSPTPTADLDKKLLDNGVNMSKTQLNELDKKRAVPKIDANTQGVQRGVQDTKNWLASIKDRVVNIFTRRQDTAADGLINYGGSHRFMAAGGSGRMSQQPAQIASGGRWITWAEDETQGESFIPHAPSKRKRSTQILAETASIFGLGLVDRGGNEVRRDGTSVAPRSERFMADGGVPANDVLKFVKGESVGGKRAPRSLEGAPYVWGGGLLGNWGDCSGAMSGIAAFITGAPLQGRKFATMNEGPVLTSMGAKPGVGSSGARMSFGWFNGGSYGGHTSGTLHFGDGNSINLEMGGGRGNGQIGGRAAGANHGQFTNHAHLPLTGGLTLELGEKDSDYDTSMTPASTSVDGVSLKSGKSVSWGKAQDLFEQASKYQQRGRFWEQDIRGSIADAMRLFDSGGVWKHGQIGVNLSGADEYVFTNAAMKDFRGATGEIRGAATELRAALQGSDWGYGSLAKLIGNDNAQKMVNAAGDIGDASIEISEAFRGNDWGYGSLSKLVGKDMALKIVTVAGQAGDAVDAMVKNMSAAVDQAEKAVLDFGRNFGGTFVGSSEIVQDAEKGLLETRANISTQAENITKAEEELKEARKALAEVESKGGGLSTAQKRKIEDAERGLNEARSMQVKTSKDAASKAKKIEDAERKLARAREDNDEALAKSADKNAQETRKAQEKVNKSEDKLRDAREAQIEAVQDLEAAERTAVAARYQAVSELAEAVGEGMQASFQSIAGLFDEFGRLADIVDDMRQSVSKLHMQQQTDVLERIKALSDLQVKTLDVDRTRARGAISVAQAEFELEEARKNATLVGLTSIEAMEGAMDRFYRTGIFSLESLTEEQVENSKEVQEALWNVQIAHKQNALDMLNAAREQEIAQYRVAEATLAQVKSARLLAIQTEHLTQMTAELDGMTKNQATGAAKGFGGIGKITGGIGKVLGGVAAGLAGFAAGGPMGALAALPIIAGGISDLAKGSVDVKNNKQEMDQAWDSMSHGNRALVVVGSGLGVAAGTAGGVVGGLDGAVIGTDVGAKLVDATIGTFEYDVASKIDAAKRRADDDVERFEREMALREHDLNMRSLDSEIRYIQNKDRAEVDLEWAKLMRESVIAPTEKLEQAFKDAAKVEAERANKNHFEQMGSLSQQNASLSQIAVTSGQQMDVTRQMLQVLSQMLESQQAAKSGVSGVGYFARV